MTPELFREYLINNYSDSEEVISNYVIEYYAGNFHKLPLLNKREA